MRIRFGQKPGSGALYLKRNERFFFKVYKINILRNLKSLLLRFHTFVVRRTRDVLDSENQPGSGSGQIRNGYGSGQIRNGYGSGALGLTGDV